MIHESIASCAGRTPLTALSRQFPPPGALIVLNDSETHYPAAVIEGDPISALRTAAVTAVATCHLAKTNFTQVSRIDCGPIGHAPVLTTLEQLTQVKNDGEDPQWPSPLN